jgi:LmbE family N-acetylglucosaminyl deacetylase
VPETSRVVILSPHLDDAVLSCWSVLTGPRPVEVVNVFTAAPPRGTGLHAGDLLTGVQDPVANAGVRVEEDRAALALAGVRPRNLDLLEHLHWVATRRLARLRGRGRLRELRDAVAGRLDGEARVYAPAGLGGHPDHVLVRELACRLLRAGSPVSFYADQPYCYVHGWPSWVTGEAPDPHLDVDGDWQRYLGSASVSFEDLRVEAVRLGPAHEDKLRALRLYRTQFSVLESGPNRRLSNPELTGRELFWHSGAAPPRGGSRPPLAGARARRPR